MSTNNDLMDPVNNDLIPAESRAEILQKRRDLAAVARELGLDPSNRDLLPEDSVPGIEDPPELSPGYEEAQPSPGGPVGDWISEELARTRADPCGFGNGLFLRRDSPGGGLHVYKGARIIRDVFDLDVEEIGTIKRYLEYSVDRP